MTCASCLLPCYKMSALLLTVLCLWHQAEAMSLLRMQPDASAYADDDAISNIAFFSPIQSKPISNSLSYADTNLDNTFSNIPEQEFILGMSAPEQTVGNTKTNLMKHLSRYLSSMDPEKYQTGLDSQNINAPNLIQKPKLSQSQFQTVQSTCSQYMNALEDSTSSEKSSVSDATLELITYLCEEYLGTDPAESLDVEEDDNYVFAQYERSNNDELRYQNKILQTEKCDCNKVDFPEEDYYPPPISRCHKPTRIARSPCHKRSSARSHIWPSRSFIQQ